MSARNRTHEKKIRSLRRALRKGRLPAFIDLIDWLQFHGYAQTAGQARKIIMDERVMHESHPLGLILIPVSEDGKEKIKVLQPRISAALRGGIHVKEAADAV